MSAPRTRALPLTRRARGSAPPATRPYPLDNHHPAAAAQHLALAQLLDPFTRGRIRRLRDLAGARCLEVGAGGGSIAQWLAEQVGPEGRVVAVDLKPEHLPAGPRLVPVGHDLAGGDLWPTAMAGPFDLICARLTLAHLPNRLPLVGRLVDRLAPGGVLLIEDWVGLRDQVVVSAPTREAQVLYQRFQRTVAAIFDRAGTDPAWARQIHPRLLDAGLAEVETYVHASYWTGGSPGLALVTAVAAQLRPRLAAAGWREPQLERLRRLLTDPLLVIHGHPLYSSSGRRV